jgi:hypothetical protein
MRKINLAIGLLSLAVVSMSACSSNTSTITSTTMESVTTTETATEAVATATTEEAISTTEAITTTEEVISTSEVSATEASTTEVATTEATTTEVATTEAQSSTSILGELKGLNGMTLSYIDTEWVDEDDTTRIAQLESLGVEVDCPNGYFIYQPDETLKTIELSDDVEILFMDEEMGTTYDADLEQLTQRLTPDSDGDVFFGFADLTIVNGKVVKITERWTV